MKEFNSLADVGRALSTFGWYGRGRSELAKSLDSQDRMVCLLARLCQDVESLLFETRVARKEAKEREKQRLRELASQTINAASLLALRMASRPLNGKSLGGKCGDPHGLLEST